MSKFRDRIVLRNLVIPPEWVRIYAPRYGYVEYAMGENAPVHTIHFSECRIDRATGRQDSTGKKIFGNDRMTRRTSVGTVSFTDDCGWRLVIIKGELSDDEYCSLPLHVYGQLFTITGMVPWEET